MQPQINFLSQEEQEQIHEAALWLLSNVGMQMPSPEAIDIMQKAGAKIEGKDIVKITKELVDRAVETAPKRDGFVLYGREEKYDIRLGKDAPPALCSMQEATHVLDLETRKRRRGTDKDLADMVRLMDALENVNSIGSLITPQDVPKETSEWYALATMLKNTSKNLCSASPGAQYIRDSIEMASLAAGGKDKFLQRPFVHYTVLTRPPMQIDRLSLEALIELSRNALPVMLMAGVISALTGPATMAGTVAQAHAEILACLVLSQLVRPGAPFLYSAGARTMDMKNATVDMPSPESATMRVAQGQMAHYLGLPQWAHGLLRNTKTLDAQAGFETAMVGVMVSMSRDMITGLQHEMDDLADFADIVFCDEAMAAIKKMISGFSIDESTLALDVIKEVGHGGDFIGSKHTLKNFRQEVWVPRLFDHRNWATWDKDGSKDIEQRAREKAQAILASHQPDQLSAEVEAKIDQIAREATLDYTRSI